MVPVELVALIMLRSIVISVFLRCLLENLMYLCLGSHSYSFEKNCLSLSVFSQALRQAALLVLIRNMRHQ